MRHLDFLFEAWDLAAEPEAARALVERIREGIDRYYIYLEAAAGEGEIPVETVWESLFESGWFRKRWRLRADLWALFRTPLSDDRVRPLLWFCLSQARRVGRLLARLERARRRGRTDEAAAARAGLVALDDALVEHLRLEALALFCPPAGLRCPRCAQPFVDREAFVGMVMFGCKYCLHTESAAADSPQLADQERRWSG